MPGIPLPSIARVATGGAAATFDDVPPISPTDSCPGDLEGIVKLLKNLGEEAKIRSQETDRKVVEGFAATNRSISSIHRELRMINGELHAITDAMVDAGTPDLREKVTVKRAEAGDIV